VEQGYRNLLSSVARLGLDGRALFAAQGVTLDAEPPTLMGASRRVLSFEGLMSLKAAAARALADDDLGFGLALVSPLDDYDVLRHLVGYAPSLGVALQVMARYHRLWESGSRFDCTTTTTSGWVHYRHCVRLPTLAARVDGQHSLGLVLRLLRQALGVWPSNVRVHVPHATIMGPWRFDALCLPEMMVYGASGWAIELPRERMDAPNPQADAALFSAIEYAAQTAMRDMPDGEVTNAVMLEVEARLREGPSLTQIAGHLGCSGRTLQRRLAAEGATFSELVECVRRRVAHELRDRPGMSAEIMAERLGYSEVSAFYRARRSWRQDASVR